MKKLLFILSFAVALVGLQSPAFATSKTVAVTTAVVTAVTPGTRCVSMELTNSKGSTGTVYYVIDGGTLSGSLDPTSGTTGIGSELAPGQSIVINKITGPVRVVSDSTASLKIITNDPPITGQSNTT